MQLNSPSFKIILDDDPTYTFGSADNLHAYEREYRLDDEHEFRPSSLYAVRVISLKDETAIASCILGAVGGATGIHEHSAVINGASLIIAIGPYMVSLRLPTLKLNWKTQADAATCFGVYHSVEQHCYISHGELDVARVSYDGKIEWSNSGADIFTNGFEVTEQRVKAVDWNNDVYVWDIRTGNSCPDIVE